jgi:hypothetical protein
MTGREKKGNAVEAAVSDENTTLMAPAVERMDNATTEERYHLDDINGDDDDDDDDDEDNNANEKVVEMVVMAI